MEFIKESVKKEITNWDQWMDSYIYKYSSLYKSFKSILEHIPYDNLKLNSANDIESPYHIWINMLRMDDLTIENIESTGCCGSVKINPTRKKIFSNNMEIAIIDNIKGEYKYVTIPLRCHSKIMSDYLNQLI